jgi:hypothetical protein
MADEREGQEIRPGGAASRDKVQTAGREANAAQPLNAAPDNAGPERYPPARRDDGVEPSGNPQPRTGAGDGPAPASTTDGRLGAGADPVEGKR